MSDQVSQFLSRSISIGSAVQTGRRGVVHFWLKKVQTGLVAGSLRYWNWMGVRIDLTSVILELELDPKWISKDLADYLQSASDCTILHLNYP